MFVGGWTFTRLTYYRVKWGSHIYCRNSVVRFLSTKCRKTPRISSKLATNSYSKIQACSTLWSPEVYESDPSLIATCSLFWAPCHYGFLIWRAKTVVEMRNISQRQHPSLRDGGTSKRGSRSENGPTTTAHTHTHTHQPTHTQISKTIPLRLSTNAAELFSVRWKRFLA